MADRSASPFDNGGVPTQINTTFGPGDGRFSGAEAQPPDLVAASLIMPSRCGSKIGIMSFCSLVSFSGSLSLQNTSCPICAKQALLSAQHIRLR